MKSGFFDASKKLDYNQLLNKDVARLYYMYSIAMILISIITTIPQPEVFERILFVGSAMLVLNIYSLFQRMEFQYPLFGANILMNIIYLTIVKFYLINESGTGSLHSLIELSVAITAVYFYGFSKAYWVPLLFIITSFVRLFLFQAGYLEWMLISNPPAIRVSISAGVLMVYVALFAGLFSKRISELISDYKSTITKLELSELKIKTQETALRETYEKLETLASDNSHLLRAPIARIKGLLIIYNELSSSVSDQEELLQSISLKEEILNSIAEFEEEYKKFNELLVQNN